MQRRLLSYLLLASLPFWLNTCTLGCQECKTITFSPEAQDYFLNFKEGSYWIYRNVANGDLDSVYFVSQDDRKDFGTKGGPICSRDYTYVRFKGMVDSLRLGFYMSSDRNTMDGQDSDAVFESDYDIGKATERTFGGKTYAKTIVAENCCLSRKCYNCPFKYLRMQRMYFAPQIGLVGWEAENYPLYGKVTYELIRYNVKR